jgi:hypothetical protein
MLKLPVWSEQYKYVQCAYEYIYAYMAIPVYGAALVCMIDVYAVKNYQHECSTTSQA